LQQTPADVMHEERFPDPAIQTQVGSDFRSKEMNYIVQHTHIEERDVSCDYIFNALEQNLH
jgi:hypothetical protein